MTALLKEKRAACYIRVSTTHQDYALQKRELTEFCQFKHWKIVETFEDKMTGSKDKRPGLDRLMADARKGKFDVVVCWRFDRFARSTRHLLQALEEFKELGVDFVSQQEGIDTSTALGKALFTIVGAIAELELSIRKERCNAGIKAAMKHGTKSGKPFGRPELEVDTDLIGQLRDQGLSWREVGQKLGISKDSAIRHFETLPALGDEVVSLEV
jgi:DNA invertase Pin-like site-specific DNA recombinase